MSQNQDQLPDQSPDQLEKLNQLTKRVSEARKQGEVGSLLHRINKLRKGSDEK